MKDAINNFISKYLVFYEKNSKFLKFSSHILLALGIYLNYLNFVEINLMKQDLLLTSFIIIALVSYCKPAFGCALMMGIYSVHLLPSSFALSIIFLVLMIAFVVGVAYEKNSIVYVAIVYLLLACENPILLGIIITLYYVLFVQRDYGMPLAISGLLIYKAVVSNLFLNKTLFNIISYDEVPENLKEHLFKFLEVSAVENELISIETITLLKENALALFLIFIISYIAFKSIRIVTSDSPFKINEHFRVSFISYGISTVLLIILMIVGSYSSPISMGNIVSVIFGSTLGFALSFLNMRYPRYGGPLYVDTPAITVDNEIQKEDEKKNFGILPYEGDDNYIFISYSHRDTEQVLPVLKELEKKGFRFWYDEGISPGDEWPEAIGAHLAECKVCLAFISENSLASRNCRQEINMALNKEKEFLSVFFNPVSSLTPGVELQISSYQSIMRYKYNSNEEFLAALTTANAIQSCKEDKTNS